MNKGKLIFEKVKNIILESVGQQKAQIMCDGSPVEIYDNMDLANADIEKYEKKYPNKKFTVEPLEVEDVSKLIDELDAMGEKKEVDMEKKIKAKSLNEALIYAKDNNIKKVKFNGLVLDVDNELRKEKIISEQKNKINKKTKVRLTETKLVDLIEHIILEVHPSKSNLDKTQKQSKEFNDKHIEDVGKKMKNYLNFEGNDNPEFPDPVGKNTKKEKYTSTEDENNGVEENRTRGLGDIKFDKEPNKDFKKRMTDFLLGSSKTGNPKDAVNTLKTDTGTKLKTNSEKRIKVKEKEPRYPKEIQPVIIKK